MTTLIERMGSHAATRPDALAVSFPPDIRYTWAQLWDVVERAAAFLHARGVAAEDRVAILSDAPHDQAIAFLGAAACGAVPTILSHPSLKQTVERFIPTFATVLEGGGVQWLIAAPELAARSSEWLAQPSTDGRVRAIAWPAIGELSVRRHAIASRTAAFLQYSSGTTGMRKGVAVSHDMLAAQADAYLPLIDFTPDDTVASWLPLYHDMGLVAALLLPLWRGGASVHVSPFAWIQRPALLLDIAAAHGGTHAWLPNFAIRVLAERAPGSLGPLRAIISAGEPVRPATFDAFLSRFGAAATVLQTSYGMAENTFAITQSSLATPPRRERIEREAFLRDRVAVPTTNAAASVDVMASGVPLPDHGVRIRLTNGEIGGERAVGEIEISSPCLFDRYLADGRVGFTDDGWFRTGDLGYLVGRELFVTGRCKDLIIHRGSNLHPEDVEDVVSRVPGVKPGRAVVFGRYDEAIGTELVIAMLETDEPEDSAAGLAQRVRAAVYESFGIVPADVRIVPAGSLLKSTSGKVSRSANRERYLADR